MMKGQNRADIIRSGIIWDEYMHIMHDEARMMGMLSGSDWSKYLVDRSVMLSGLKPVTTGRKLVEARAWQEQIAHEAGKQFDELGGRFRRAMEGFGITAQDWQVMRLAKDNRGFVTPMLIMEKTGRRDVAEKLAELTSSFSERSVPSSSVNAKARVFGTSEAGTLTGELARSFTQFKSFGLSFTTLQIEAMSQIFYHEGGGAIARQFSALAIGMTLGGAMYMQIKSLLDGKDLADMTRPDFWARAMVQGGGFGLLGDLISSSENRFGKGMAESLIVGPAASFASDVVNVGAAAVGQALGANRNAGREAIKLMQRYTPVLSSHWATRSLYRHMVLDQLQFLGDPQAHQAFKRQISKAKSDGQDFWWRPGQMTPQRQPKFW